MRAAIVEAPGKVSVVSLPDPTPGPRDVVVKVAACGLCGTDLHILQGEFAPTLPLVPGHEFAGEVVGVGAEVTELSIGDQVAVDPTQPSHQSR
ncbi:alcohol dehydrogenase catalytic domain-containing protein, partial [Streptomyces sp. NPDC058548]|uniref:alcohol dehydrogenase catalytic domain-containing protein n=1 Tax=Streptomyces sp. NPDC058548 TaxID=3346545 RepID=UPI00364F302D